MQARFLRAGRVESLAAKNFYVLEAIRLQFGYRFGQTLVIHIRDRNAPFCSTDGKRNRIPLGKAGSCFHTGADHNAFLHIAVFLIDDGNIQIQAQVLKGFCGILLRHSGNRNHLCAAFLTGGREAENADRTPHQENDDTSDEDSARHRKNRGEAFHSGFVLFLFFLIQYLIFKIRPFFLSSFCRLLRRLCGILLQADFFRMGAFLILFFDLVHIVPADRLTPCR